MRKLRLALIRCSQLPSACSINLPVVVQQKSKFKQRFEENFSEG